MNPSSLPQIRTSSEFSWTDRDSVVINKVDAIAVYENNDGDIVIRQEAQMGEDDSVIIIPTAQAEAVMTAIAAIAIRGAP